MDKLDKQYMAGKITGEQYDAEVRKLEQIAVT